MTKEEFILKSESRLSSLENDSKFKNYSKQLLADKLKADFNKTYKLDYLWRKSLIAISSSCFILENDTNSKIALKSLYKIANNLENISEIEESSSQFDVDFLRILSALCYDVSGYQANAYCIAKKINEYQLSSDLDIDLTEDNGTGFVFSPLSPDTIVEAVERAKVFYADKENLEKARKRAMSVDSTWHQSAEKYVDVYSSLL